MAKCLRESEVKFRKPSGQDITDVSQLLPVLILRTGNTICLDTTKAHVFCSS